MKIIKTIFYLIASMLVLLLVLFSTTAFAQFDGTGDFFSGDVPNGKYFSLDQYGRYTAVGDSALAWEDIRVSAQNLKINPLSEKPDFVPFSAGRTYLFDASSPESLYFAVQIPHNYKFGTDLYAHIHWCPTNTDNGAVQWGIRYSLANLNDVLSANGTGDTMSFVDSADGTARKHQYTGLGAIDGSGIDDISSMILFTLYRIAGASADDYNTDAAILEFDLHYQIDSFGSRWELIK